MEAQGFTFSHYIALTLLFSSDTLVCLFLKSASPSVYQHSYISVYVHCCSGRRWRLYSVHACHIITTVLFHTKSSYCNLETALFCYITIYVTVLTTVSNIYSAVHPYITICKPLLYIYIYIIMCKPLHTYSSNYIKVGFPVYAVVCIYIYIMCQSSHTYSSKYIKVGFPKIHQSSLSQSSL